MDVISKFLSDYSHFISLINGLAFFVLGLSVALESEGAGRPKLAGPHFALSGYGFLAALFHWQRMFMLTRVEPTPSASPMAAQVAGLLCLVLAALFLLRFATQLIAGDDGRLQWVRWGPVYACGAYVVAVGSLLVRADVLSGAWVQRADVLARYLLLLPGLALTALGLWRESGHSRKAGLLRITRDRVGASLGFGAKAIASGVVAFPVFGYPQALAPAGVLAISASRTLTTIVIAYCVVRMLRGLEAERNRQYAVAVQERFAAQQEALAVQHQMQSEVERWARQLEDVIDGISAAMSTATGLGEVLDVSLSQVLELTGFSAGDVRLTQAEHAGSQISRQSGLSSEAQECGMCLWMEAKASQDGPGQRESVVVRNLLDEPDLACSPCLEAGLNWLVSVPITCQGETLGMMNLLGKDRNEPQAHELRVLSAIGQQIGVAIENARLREQAQSVAALEERERLGRDLHDGVAQVLGYLHLQSHKAADLVSAGEVGAAQEELGEMHAAARDALTDVRSSILTLRTTIAPDGGVIPALAEYVRRYNRQSGIKTELVVGDDSVEFSPLVEIQLLCIVQEALTNARKHARATEAYIKLETAGDHAVISIEDNGQGLDMKSVSSDGHYGLHTMRERAQGVGGDLQILSQIGHGTKVVVRLPIMGRTR